MVLRQNFIELSGQFLETILCKWLKTVKEKTSLSYSQRTGIIRIIYKKGNRNDLKNWRPISLLNTDYKIIKTALTNRLKKVIGSIIHPDQSCSIPHRDIQDNCATIQDVLHWCFGTEKDLSVISLDQTKAFNKVNWTHLSRVLGAFSLGPSFQKWVKIVYSNIGSHVIVNGYLSSRIDIHRGVRQGCPLSPLLYVLSFKPLASAIGQNPIIQGVPTVDDSLRDSIKVSSYADDMTVFLTTETSFQALNDELTVYNFASGAHLNREKSVGLWLGKWKRQENQLQIKWTTTAIKILGLTFSPSYYESMKENWSMVLQKLKKTVDIWKSRDLSYLG